MRLLASILVGCAGVHMVVAHGSHSGTGSSSNEPRSEDWATWHLEEEHHISNFDPASFFTLHDFNNDGVWTPDEVRRTYGLDDESLADVIGKTKDEVVSKVMSIFDPDKTGQITRPQFLQHIKDGKVLPDFGLGPGHHGDMEYEYEIHHFEKFHGPDTTEADLIHPEDIEHFRMHDMLEDEQARVDLEQSQSIVEANIPLKFKKQQ